MLVAYPMTAWSNFNFLLFQVNLSFLDIVDCNNASLSTRAYNGSSLQAAMNGSMVMISDGDERPTNYSAALGNNRSSRQQRVNLADTGLCVSDFRSSFPDVSVVTTTTHQFY